MKIKLSIWCLLVFMLTCRFASAQQNNSLYFLDRLPQRIQLNPALQPGCTFYIGVPLISSIEINAGNNALGINDILIKNNELGNLVTPLFSKEITAQTLKKLRDNNIISTGIQIDLISFGFKIKDSYVSFLISEKVNVDTNIPKDLAVFAYEGIDEGKSFVFDNLGIKADYYREYSIGYSQKINDKLYFGVRGKMLFGKANVSFKQSDISINEPEWKTFEVSSSVKLNSSIPLLNTYADATGKLDSLNFKDIPNINDFIHDIGLLKRNRGYGVDLGIQFNATEELSISASILDLGFINWKSNINTLTGGGDYLFKGINLNDSTDNVKALLDTIQKVYDVTVSSDPYITTLTPKMYLALSYAPYKFLKLGLLSRSEYILKNFRQQFTGSLTFYPFQSFGTTISYTVANRLYDNLGVGFVFRGGPLQMYVMSERIPISWNKVKGSRIPLPVYAKEFNLRLGLNLVFGANTHRKMMKDQPFLD